jgi:hypothetical protein
MLGGSVDIHAIIDQLRHGGGNVIVINPGSAAGVPMEQIGGHPGENMPPHGGMPPMPPDDQMISNGAPPALGGPDIEGPAEDMMGAVKAGLSKMPKKGPPKPPSKGVGKGPANPQTKPGSAKLPAKKSDAKSDKKEPPKKGK